MNQTHFYDGKWMEIYQQIKTKYPSNISFRTACQQIVEQYQQTTHIINMMLIDKRGNYDPINELNLEDILPLTWEYIKDTELKSLFIEQLLDIKNGPCPQGRTTRVFQILQLLYKN